MAGVRGPGRQAGLRLVVVGLVGAGHGGLCAGCQSQSRRPRGPLSGPVAWSADGRSLCGLQGDDLGQGWGDRPGFLLVSCEAQLRPGRQGLAAVEAVGLGMAAADSRALPTEPSRLGGREGLGGVSGRRTAALRQAVAEIEAKMEAELARADLPTPCRKVLESLAAHWEGLTLFVDDPQITMDNNTSERRAGSGGGTGRTSTARVRSGVASWRRRRSRSSPRWHCGGLNPRKWLTWYFEVYARRLGARSPRRRASVPAMDPESGEAGRLGQTGSDGKG